MQLSSVLPAFVLFDHCVFCAAADHVTGLHLLQELKGALV
jgi:hypothetical protein